MVYPGFFSTGGGGGDGPLAEFAPEYFVLVFAIFGSGKFTLSTLVETSAIS